MLWRDYLDGWGNHEAFLKEKYGTAGIFMVDNMNRRFALDISDKYKVYSDPEQMVFGQFVNAEQALTGGFKDQDALRELVNQIIRPIEDKVFDNTNEEKEILHIENVLNEDAKDILSVCSIFTENRNYFIKVKYKGVFYQVPDEDEDTDEKEQIEKDNPLSPQEKAEKKFRESFYWYSIVDSLAEHKLWQHDIIQMLPVSQVAPHLAYTRAKNLIEQRRRKLEAIAAQTRR